MDSLFEKVKNNRVEGGNGQERNRDWKKRKKGRGIRGNIASDQNLCMGGGD